MQSNNSTTIDIFNKSQKKVFYVFAGLFFLFGLFAVLLSFTEDISFFVMVIYLGAAGCALIFLARTQTRIVNILAGILFVLSVIWFIVYAAADNIETAFYPAAIGVAVGCVIIFFTRAISKRVNRYSQYINLIMYQGIVRVDTIVEASNIPYTVVVGDLKKMAAQEIIKKDVVDQLLYKNPADQKPQPTAINNVRTSRTSQMVTVVCPGCGAKMTVAKGAVCNCEYCDTPIHV